MKVKFKWALIVFALIFFGLQLTSPERTNPEFDESRTLQSTTDVPPDISAVFARSCNDCHSNLTNWKWYTHIAPISWFAVGHVNDGRSELNFSEWGDYGKRMKKTRLVALCYQVEKGLMPLSSYVPAHPEAALSGDEVKMICEWAEKESKQIK